MPGNCDADGHGVCRKLRVVLISLFKLKLFSLLRRSLDVPRPGFLRLYFFFFFFFSFFFLEEAPGGVSFAAHARQTRTLTSSHFSSPARARELAATRRLFEENSLYFSRESPPTRHRKKSDVPQNSLLNTKVPDAKREGLTRVDAPSSR